MAFQLRVTSHRAARLRPPRTGVRLALVLAAGTAVACGAKGPTDPDGGSDRLAVSTAHLAFGSNEVEKPIEIENRGSVPVAWSAELSDDWFLVSPESGMLPSGRQLLTVRVIRDSIDPGTHVGELRFVMDGMTFPVQVTAVSDIAPAKLALSPPSVDLRTTFTSQTTGVMNTGDRPLTWSASGGAPWVTLSKTSGTVAPHSLQPVVVTVSRSGLAEGIHETSFTITSNGGSKEFAVRLEVASTSPPPTPPPPSPPPPPSGSIALQGRAVDQFSGAGMAGLTVSFAGETAVTDGSGNFSISGDPSSSLRALEFNGGPIHTRKTFARSNHVLWEVIPSSFDIPAFNDVAREFEPRTIRWTQNPRIYIDTRAHNFPGGGPVPQSWINEIEGAVSGHLSGWSNGVLHPASVTVTASPPPDGSNNCPPAGTVVIEFDENPDRYSGSQAVGLTRTCWTGQRDIFSAHVWLRLQGLGDASVRRAIVIHELGHALGMGHMTSNSPTSSIMKPTISIPDLSTFDRRTGEIVYSRSPGNTSPDTDSQSTFLGGLAPAAVPADSYEWVCGADPGAWVP